MYSEYIIYNASNMSHIPFEAMYLCIFSQNQDDRMANTIGLRMKTESDADHVFLYSHVTWSCFSV